MDGKTCELCRALHGQIFKFSQMESGINFPPFHEWCRCSFEIVMPTDREAWINDYVARHGGDKLAPANILNKII